MLKLIIPAQSVFNICSLKRQKTCIHKDVFILFFYNVQCDTKIVIGNCLIRYVSVLVASQFKQTLRTKNGLYNFVSNRFQDNRMTLI